MLYLFGQFCVEYIFTVHMYKELPMAVQFLHIIEKTIFQNTIILTFFSDIYGSQLLST